MPSHLRVLPEFEIGSMSDAASRCRELQDVKMRGNVAFESDLQRVLRTNLTSVRGVELVRDEYGLVRRPSGVV